MVGGFAALVGAIVVGPRTGRFLPDGSAVDIPGHNAALAFLGTFILWFGWYGFNPGSALLLEDNDNVGSIAAHAAVSTALAGASGGISALFTNLYIQERLPGEPHFSILMAMNGSLSGLVAITASCAIVEPWAALVIGCIAGWVYMWSSKLLVRFRIDDAVDAIPVHMFNGIWGMIATGLFASPEKLEMTFNTSKHVGWFYSWGRGSGDAALLACQSIAVVFVIGWTAVTIFPFFIWLNYKGWLRSDSLEELVGLDISYHGGSLSGEDGNVKKEYVEAYRRHKKSSSRGNTYAVSNDRWHSSAAPGSDPESPRDQD